MRVLALDIGRRRIGTALSDPLGITAQPLKTVEVHGLDRALQELADLACKSGAERIVAGFPRDLSGKVGEQARWTLDLIERLRQCVSVPVVLWDERMSSAMAERSLIEAGVRRSKRKEAIHQAAAILILQGYLDSLSSGIQADGESAGEK